MTSLQPCLPPLPPRLLVPFPVSSSRQPKTHSSNCGIYTIETCRRLLAQDEVCRPVEIDATRAILGTIWERLTANIDPALLAEDDTINKLHAFLTEIVVAGLEEQTSEAKNRARIEAKNDAKNDAEDDDKNNPSAGALHISDADETVPQLLSTSHNSYSWCGWEFSAPMCTMYEAMVQILFQ